MFRVYGLRGSLRWTAQFTRGGILCRIERGTVLLDHRNQAPWIAEPSRRFAFDSF